MDAETIPSHDGMRDTPLRNLLGAIAVVLLFTWTPLAMWTAKVLLDGTEDGGYMECLGRYTRESPALNDYAVGGAFIASGLLPLMLIIGAYRHPRLLLAIQVAAVLDGMSLFWLA
jgi:hypothetical protein